MEYFKTNHALVIIRTINTIFGGTNMQTKKRLHLLYNTDQKNREKSRENVEDRQRENE